MIGGSGIADCAGKITHRLTVDRAMGGRRTDYPWLVLARQPISQAWPKEEIRGRLCLNGIKGCIEIGDQIINRFDADRQAQQILGHLAGLALDRLAVLNQALNPTQGGRR